MIGELILSTGTLKYFIRNHKYIIFKEFYIIVDEYFGMDATIGALTLRNEF